MLDVLLVGTEELENLSNRYLAVVLRQHGFPVAIASFGTAQATDAVVRQAQHTRPRLIGLSIISQHRAPEFLALAARLRDALPTAHIATGGHFPTFVAPELLRDYPALDSVVRGEGELTLLELVQSLDTPTAWGAIRGLGRGRQPGLSRRTACGRTNPGYFTGTEPLCTLAARDSLHVEAHGIHLLHGCAARHLARIGYRCAQICVNHRQIH